MLEIRATPASEAPTPSSFSTVKRSTRSKAPHKSVQMEDVEARIVLDATVVYARQAAAK